MSNPVYDLHRYGIAFVASPRHADMLMVTGVVTRNLEQALRMTYDAMPEPKMVMACGACACGGETYGSTYAVVGRQLTWCRLILLCPDARRDRLRLLWLCVLRQIC